MTWDKAMLKVGSSQLKTIILVSICSPYIALRNNDVIQGNLLSFYRYQLGIATESYQLHLNRTQILVPRA